MKLIKLSLLYMILLTISLTVLHDKVNAIRGMKSMGSELTAKINHVVRIAPRPPGWPQMWLARDIIKSLHENELIAESSINSKAHEQFDFPAMTNEVIKFSVSLNENVLSGCVLEFDKKENFEKVREHYLALNENKVFHTWSLVKDNILVIIDGAMPEQTVKEYELTLRDMK